MIAFAWDTRKAGANLRKHGVSFALASEAFRDVFAIEWVDEREAYGEPRMILLGMAAAILLAVVCVERGDRVRLISARRATCNERKIHLAENGP